MFCSKSRVLFVLKNRPAGPPGSWSYSCGSDGPLPSGMSVSVQQMVIGLHKVGIDAKLVQVVDNNSIHREVKAYKPTHVVIEGFWVVPEKFAVLEAACPGLLWIVRCHSNTEFLAHEGNVFGWAIDYIKRGITVAFNSETATEVFRRLIHDEHVNRKGGIVYLPNYYETETHHPLPLEWFQHLKIKHPRLKKHGEFHVGCFGAVRPLKNHMNQALAALEVAHDLGLKLRFYVNANRIEGKADSLVNSMRSLFKRVGPHELIEVPWMEHCDFLDLIHSMDIVSQVSMSETFNIVLADSVAASVPVIGANIPWLDSEYQANPIDVENISRVMHLTWLKSGNGTVQHRQRRTLVNYVNNSLRLWVQYLKTSTADMSCKDRG